MTSPESTAALAPLAARLRDLTAEEPSRDDILTGFLDYAAKLGLELYPAQEEAVLELLEWRHVILNTPTGSGKSLVAMALHFQAMAEGRVSYYTCPIKALVNEKFFDLCDAFGPENVGLLTGDASVNGDAPIICCTQEILANRALRDEQFEVDYVVVDEFHFYGDRERGAAWQIPLITLKNTVFLLMSATLGDTSQIVSKLSDFTDRDVSVVSGAERPVPLEFQYRETPIQETVTDLLEAEEAPIYVVNFTQRGCAEQAQALTSVNVCAKEVKQAIARELKTARFDTPYGKEIRRFLSVGIGVHHAGLLPKYRRLTERLAQAGLLKVICGTDSLGVGVNIPIRCVLFRALSKFDGEKTRILSARQFHQIAGRAGRKGFDDHGLVVVQAPEHVIENKRIEAKLVKNPHLRNKLRKKKPPPRFVHWDKSTFERLKGSPPEALEPQFTTTHGMLVNVLLSDTKEQGGGYRRLMNIIRRSHGTDGQKTYERKRAASLFRSLRQAGIVDIVPNGDRPGAAMVVNRDLQLNFSLNQTLSLYVVEALDLLDKAAESYALDMVTLVESVLEDPKVILFRQIDLIKGELVARLKAEGVPYEERMAELDKVEHPKPLRELVYESFNGFAKFHPWVGGENIKPKTVAREMYERCFSFNDYIHHLGASRSEGVLLRYLSQAYRTIHQTIPESYWTDALDEIKAFLLTAIQHTDASLLEEWEVMMTGEARAPEPVREPEAERTPKPVDLAADPKKLAARVRNELYMLQRALADRRFNEAAALIRQTEENPWTPDDFAEAMAPYFAEHAAVDLTPRARTPRNTVIRESAPKRYDVVQKIIDSEGDEDFALFGEVDLTDPAAEDAPLAALIRIGV